MSFVKEHRTYESLVFDLGDHSDRVDPATEATKGKINTHLLNALMPTAVTIGNNEGITFPHDWLADLYTEADFPVLVSNLEAPFAKQGVIHELPTRKVGVFGLTAPYIELYGLLDWTIEEPFDVAAREIERLRQEVDVLICLSHLGFYQDEELAMRFPELDLIIGAHTHHVLDDGVVKNGVLITQAGKHGQYAGEIYMNTDTGEKEAVLHSLYDYVEDEATAKLLDREQYLAEQQMKEPIGETGGLANDWFSEAPFSQLLVETMRDWCEADIACVPAGILLGSLPPAPVSAFDLHRLSPHPNNPCKVTMTGMGLQTFLDEVNTEQFEHLKVRGPGLRAKLLGRMHYAGLADHQPLELRRDYSVVLPDMFTFGPLFPAIKEMPKEYFMPELLRDLLFERLSEKSEYNELHVRKP
jgi:2',3'-cyclic-nucleotide 2'-phosphodiesterase (5'-nucleotidase family)